MYDDAVEELVACVVKELVASVVEEESFPIVVTPFEAEDCIILVAPSVVVLVGDDEVLHDSLSDEICLAK